MRCWDWGRWTLSRAIWRRIIARSTQEWSIGTINEEQGVKSYLREGNVELQRGLIVGNSGSDLVLHGIDVSQGEGEAARHLP